VINININPVIFSLAGLEIRWYGAIILIAIGIAYLLTRKEFQKRKLPLSFLSDLTFWSVIGGTIGARLFHIFSMMDYYIANPLKVFAFQEGGLSIQGAVIGGFIAGYVVTRLKGFKFLSILDSATPGIILGTALGRFACIINGDTWGTPTAMPWGFVYNHPNALIPIKGIPLHPTPLYEMLWGFLIFSFLYPLRTRFQKAGMLFAIFMILYFSGRFFIEFFRGDSHYIFGFRIAHIISLVVITGAILWFFLLQNKKYKEVNYG
jgi:phosphatidylglycerol:prolipoprotein diacylglycerol transferase